MNETKKKFEREKKTTKLGGPNEQKKKNLFFWI